MIAAVLDHLLNLGPFSHFSLPMIYKIEVSLYRKKEQKFQSLATVDIKIL